MNPLERSVTSLDWISLVLLLGLVALTVGKYLYHGMFLNFIILPFNDKYVVLHQKKGQLYGGFQVLMTLFQWLNLSLFIFLCLRAFGGLPELPHPWAFTLILGFLSLFQIVKSVLQLFTGFVFNALDPIVGFMFGKLSYLNHSSIVLCVANLFLAYILVDSKTVIYIALILVLLINGMGALKLLKNHQKAMLPYFMYFILYLCALEIAPLVLLGSYLKG